MLDNSLIQSIDNAVLCWLATVSSNGQPNVSPKEIFTHYGSDHILIANIMSPNSIKNIKQNDQVCVSFIDVLVQKGHKVKGSAEIIEKSNTEFKVLHDKLYAIAGPDFPILSIIKIKIDAIAPIIAPRYVLFPQTKEEDQIDSARRQYNL